MTIPDLKAYCLRQATAADIPGIFVVRHAVRENTVRPGAIADEDVRREIEDTGRGWVIDSGGHIVAFAIGNARTGNVWALFVSPAFAGRGHGSQLHDESVDWLWSQGLRHLWLTTGATTQARGFYERRGWRFSAEAEHGQVRLELHANRSTAAPLGTTSADSTGPSK